MIKNCLLIISFFLIPKLCLSQAINWQWARGTDSRNYEECRAVTTDPAGNVYVTGFFQGASATFGSFTLYNSGVSNIFVVKYSPAGNVLWARSTTRVSSWAVSCSGQGLVTDKQGNVYVTGYYGGDSVIFGNTALPNLGTSNNTTAFFIAKYDSLGNLLWINTPEVRSNGGDVASGIALDGNGHLFITGWFSDYNIDFGSNILQAVGVSNIFIAKYDTNGHAIWAQKGEGGYSLYGAKASGIAVDSLGNAYITGWFLDDSITFGSTTLVGNGYPDADNFFIARYDPSGHAVWAKGAFGVEDCYGSSIALSGNNNIYVTGTYLGYSITFDSLILFPYIDNSGTLFIAKYDADGKAIWAKTETNSAQSNGYSIATDLKGNIYTSGAFSGNEITFDTRTLTVPSTSADPMYVITLDSAGNVICGSGLQSGGFSNSVVCLDKAGAAYLASDYVQNNFIVGHDTLNLLGPNPINESSVFVAKFNCPTCDGLNLEYQVSPPSICKGDTALITFTGDSGLTISPASDVIWLDSLHALLKPDSTTVFSISGFVGCGAHRIQTFTLPVFEINKIHITTHQKYICPHDSVLICVTPGFSYIWTTGDTTACIYTQTAGTYSVTASDNGRCSAHVKYEVFDYSPLPFMINKDGDTLSYYKGTSYQWLLNGIAISGADSTVFIAPGPGAYSLQITDSENCKVISDTLIISGIKETGEDHISVFPNPSTGKWELIVENNLIGSSVEVFDDAGRLIFKSLISKIHSSITLPGVVSGVYILRIATSNGIDLRKLIKL